MAQLTFRAKLLEHHVALTLRDYLQGNCIDDMFQSAYRAKHDTKAT